MTGLFICRITYSDLVYVILFPQLLMAVHFPKISNTHGSLAAYVVAIILRIGGGEELLKLKAFIHYPYYEPGDEAEGKWERQLFPFRTLTMIISLLTLVIVSAVSDRLCKKKVKGILQQGDDSLFNNSNSCTPL